VRTKIYSCKCARKHTIHFDGEHLGLYVWSRQTIVVQESLQLLLKQMQRGPSGFGALLEGQQEAFRRVPQCAVLSEETWRKASLDFFPAGGAADPGVLQHMRSPSGGEHLDWKMENEPPWICIAIELVMAPWMFGKQASAQGTPAQLKACL
jgi:hypothetical protein